MAEGFQGSGRNYKFWQKRGEVLWNKSLGESCFRMGILFDSSIPTPWPGQFVMVQTSDYPTPLLRRPFSIHNLIEKESSVFGFEILYKVTGQGTSILSGKSCGEFLNVLGPLGKGFSYSTTYRNIFMVAGGIGVAPLYFLSKTLERLTGSDKISLRILIGGKTARDILCAEELQSLGADVYITTEDGSLGSKGLVTQSFQEAVENKGRADIVYACGPKPLLKEVSRIASLRGIRCQVSLETNMACGFGACLGCAVGRADKKEGYFHVCSDGPVFDSNEIDWQTL